MARERVSEIVAEMVANVMSVAVEPGDKVAAGDVVILLESMKMEIPVIAEDDGTVRAVKIAPATSSRRATCWSSSSSTTEPVRSAPVRLQQRGRDSNPRLTSLPATAFKAVPIGHSGTPPCAPACRRTRRA